MAKAGLGIVNLPRFIIGQSLEKGELIEILPEYKQQKLEIHVVYPNRRHLPIKVRAFIEFLSGLGLCSEIWKILKIVTKHHKKIPHLGNPKCGYFYACFL